MVLYICLQTDLSVNSLKDSNTTLSGDDRSMIQGLSQNLNAALQPSTTDNRPIPPRFENSSFICGGCG